jgi:UDP-glucuronate 4-epimerase
MEGSTILVTGAAGFIGSHAAEALLARGNRVVGVDNFDEFYSRTIKESNLKSVSSRAGERGGRFEFEQIDITDAPSLAQLVARVMPDAVLHMAALAGVRASIERPAQYARVNVEGTTHLLEAAVKHGVRRFIFASSSSVYGNNAKVPFAEDDLVAEPISPYAATKRAGELICHAYWHLYRLPVTCLRFFTVYGPRQRPDLAIHKFTRLISEGKPIPVFGDGSTSRDYTFIDDIIAGVMSALDRCDRYRVYNLGGSSPVTLATLIEQIERGVGKKAILDRKPAQPGDVERTFADLTRSRAELGYAPKTPIEQGIRRFVAWFNSPARG